jgi:hypothetical protein
MATTVATIPEILDLVDRLGDALEQYTAAIGLCDQIDAAVDRVDGDSSWYHVQVEARSVRDVLPGGDSTGDPLEAFAVLRDLAQLAARRS